jgi:hypothetical protein
VYGGRESDQRCSQYKTFPGSSVKVQHAQESWNVFNVERMVMFIQFYYLHFRILNALSSFN